MASYRRFRATDLFDLNYINLDKYTENYGVAFYMAYFLQWPEYNRIALSLDRKPVAYVMGKCEGKGRNWHGHVTALTVAPSHRRMGLGQQLMRHLEDVSEAGSMYFVDLYVRRSNGKAHRMYEKLGYRVYRTVKGYYTGLVPEDGLDMRKPLAADPHGHSLISPKPEITVDELYDE